MSCDAGGGQRETLDGGRSGPIEADQGAGGEPATQDGVEPGEYSY